MPFRQLDPTDLDAVKYVASIFDLCLIATRQGGSGRLFVRRKDGSITETLQQAAGGSVTVQGDGMYVWYGSIRDWAFYKVVLEHMHSPMKKMKLAEAISGSVQRKIERAEKTPYSGFDHGNARAADEQFKKLIQQVHEIQDRPPAIGPDPTIDADAPNGRYRDGTPRLPFEGKKPYRDLTPEEKKQFSDRLKSRPKIRLAVESLQLLMLLGEKHKHPAELIERARARRKLIQDCVLTEGVDACVEKHAPSDFPSWFDFGIEEMLKEQ